MKLETYKATPGLDRIPPAERYATYRAAHQRLLREDEAYRKRHHHYLVAVILVAVFSGSAWFGSTALGILASMLLDLIPVAAILCLVFRQQRHMNQCIGAVLQAQLR